MSLDVSLYGPPSEVPCACNCCGNEHTRTHREEFFEYNITHNLNVMAGKAGLYDAMWQPGRIPATKAADLIPHLERGLADLQARPEYFKRFNPENGWGSYDGLVQFAHEYLAACKEHPEADIDACR